MCYRDENVLVTGGCGFVGGHVAQKLLEKGSRVTVLDNNTERDCLVGNELMPRWQSELYVKNCDVTDFDKLRQVIHGGDFRYVFHFAASAAVIEKAVDNPFEAFRSNTLGLVHVLESVRLLDRNPPTVFFASTDKVYGTVPEGEVHDEEKTALRGIGVYDSTKLAADVLCRTYHEVYGLKTVVLRMCNLIGPWDLNVDYRLLPKAMVSIFGTDPPCAPELYADSLGHWREYLYIDDAVNIILKLTCLNQSSGQAYNLPGSAYLSTPQMLGHIVETASQVYAARASLIRDNGIVVRQRRMGDNSRTGVVIAVEKQRMSGDRLRAALQRSLPPYADFLNMALPKTLKWYSDYRGLLTRSAAQHHGQQLGTQSQARTTGQTMSGKLAEDEKNDST